MNGQAVEIEKKVFILKQPTFSNDTSAFEKKGGSKR